MKRGEVGAKVVALALVVSSSGCAFLSWSSAPREPEQGSVVAGSNAAVSGDGSLVAFVSSASNLAEDDTNGLPDVFVRDEKTGIIERVSLATDGTQANGASASVAMSPDGRYVAFASSASNLVPGDTNGADDVFLRDRQTGTTTRASVTSTGMEANGASAGPAVDVTGTVGFTSSASNLVPGDTNGVADVFAHGTAVPTARVNVAAGGQQADAGQLGSPIAVLPNLIAFTSSATNLVSGDTNGAADVFLRSTMAGTTERVSVGGGG